MNKTLNIGCHWKFAKHLVKWLALHLKWLDVMQLNKERQDVELVVEEERGKIKTKV
jgi:hypothetical protein